MNLPQPKHNNVLLKEIEVKKQHGSILIADMGNEKAMYCEVIAVGPGTYTMNGVFINVTSNVGEKVIIPSFGGQKVTYEGEEYIVVKDTDILLLVD
jgi:chaperonin GroES